MAGQSSVMSLRKLLRMPVPNRTDVAGFAIKQRAKCARLFWIVIFRIPARRLQSPQDDVKQRRFDLEACRDGLRVRCFFCDIGHTNLQSDKDGSYLRELITKSDLSKI